MNKTKACKSLTYSQKEKKAQYGVPMVNFVKSPIIQHCTIYHKENGKNNHQNRESQLELKSKKIDSLKM